MFLFIILSCFVFLQSTAVFAARIAGEEQPVSTSNKQDNSSADEAQTGKTKAARPSVPLHPQTQTPARQETQSATPLPPPATVRPLPPSAQPVPVARPPAPVGASERSAPSQVQQSPTGASPPSSPGSAPAKDTRYVTIDFDNVDIQVFVKFISELTGKNFIIDDKVKGKVTVISPKKIAVDDVYKVFESVLEVYGFATVEAGDVIKIIPTVDVRGKKVQTLLQNEKVAVEDRIVTQIISLEYADANEMKKVLDPLIPRSSVIISYPPTGMLVISDVLSNVKKLREIISALDVKGVGAQITYLPLHYASATESVKSLNAIFQQQQKGPSPIRIVADDRTNSLIMMASESDTANIKELIDLMDREIPQAGTLLHIYRLQNANAEDLAKVLMNLPKDSKDAAQKGKSPVLSKEVNVIPDKATNTLIITAERADYLILEDVIKKLDVPRPMVYIEALIMEVSLNKDFKLGVEWSALKDTGKITDLYTVDSAGSAIPARSGAFISSSGSGTVMPGYDASTGIVSFPSGFSVGILGAGIKIGNVVFPSIGAVLQAYQTDEDVSILSTPQLLTVDNEEAEINVGENRPYLTRQETTSTTSYDYSTYEYKDVGVILKITSHINDESFVRLKVDQQVTRVVSATTSTLPVTRKRTAKTTVVVKDGETVVIGGLVGDTTDVATYKVPCLGNIPLLGWLFKTVDRNKEKTNLFVFITPHIIRNQEDAAVISEKKRGEVGRVQDGVIKMYEKKPSKKDEKGN
ncbi:MAG: type II secretion system secretin GspD [Deltaproteobacteria bacterium]|nr:type II secretion system secretin GspD [Deltaproteobacteria bacterium]